jgi:hypothetical protein
MRDALLGMRVVRHRALARIGADELTYPAKERETTNDRHTNHTSGKFDSATRSDWRDCCNHASDKGIRSD